MSSEMAAAMPPPGSSSDFSQHSELWPSLIAVSVISLVIMTLAVSLRLYARIFKSASKALRVDDYMSLGAVILIIIWTIIYAIAGHYGVSKHQWNIPASVIPRMFNLLNICDILYGPMLLLAKLSLLIQLHRHHALPRILYYATGTLIVGYYFSCIFQFAFQCVPRRGLWDTTAHATCGNMTALTFCAAAFGLATNVGLYVGLCVQGKFAGWRAVGLVHGIALLALVCSITTVYYRMPFTDAGGDLTYHVAIVGIWAMAEYAALIVAGCTEAFGAWVVDRKGGNDLDAEKGLEGERSSAEV